MSFRSEVLAAVLRRHVVEQEGEPSIYVRGEWLPPSDASPVERVLGHADTERDSQLERLLWVRALWQPECPDCADAFGLVWGEGDREPFVVSCLVCESRFCVTVEHATVEYSLKEKA